MRHFVLIGRTIEILFCAAVFLSILWMYHVSIPREIIKGYRRSVRLHMSLPFNTRWVDEVAPEHVSHIRKFRKAQFSLPLLLLAFGLWVIAYADLLGPQVLMMLAAGRCGH
jgi:hypothetical protein